MLFDYDEDEETGEKDLTIQISNDSGDDEEEDKDTEKDTIPEEGSEVVSDPEPETE